MNRYSCRLDSKCEQDIAGKYSDYKKCNNSCVGVDNKDVLKTIISYSPELLFQQAPSDIAYSLKVEYGFNISPGELNTLGGDFYKLLEYEAFTPYLIERCKYASRHSKINFFAETKKDLDHLIKELNKLETNTTLSLATDSFIKGDGSKYFSVMMYHDYYFRYSSI